MDYELLLCKNFIGFKYLVNKKYYEILRNYIIFVNIF